MDKMKMREITSNQIFTTKANTLNFLKYNLKKSKIEKLVIFTISDWKKNEDEEIKKIQHEFCPNKIVIRSSAQGEDSFHSSLAGKYLSILEVDSNSKNKIRKAVNSVINSYDDKNTQNQILIQKQTTDVISSGVIFTHQPEFLAPYYIINYELGESTTSVTGGITDNVIKLFRGNKINEIPKEWKKLIIAVKELNKFQKIFF